jgi:hypothetical protein
MLFSTVEKYEETDMPGFLLILGKTASTVSVHIGWF